MRTDFSGNRAAMRQQKRGKMRGIGIVNTAYGRVSGEEINGITVFRSIPYAAPPTGELRWRAPREHEPWDGVRECTGISWHQCTGNISPE